MDQILCELHFVFLWGKKERFASDIKIFDCRCTSQTQQAKHVKFQIS